MDVIQREKNTTKVENGNGMHKTWASTKTSMVQSIQTNYNEGD